MSSAYERPAPPPDTGPPRSPTGGPDLPQDGSRLPRDDRSIGQIIGDLGQDLSTLLRQEVDLAKAEVQQTVQRTAKGAGMFGAAGVAGLMVLVFLSLALWWVLGRAIGTATAPALAVSGVIVAAIWAVIAVVLSVVGKSEMKKAPGVPQTKETLTQIPDALKGDEENNR